VQRLLNAPETVFLNGFHPAFQPSRAVWAQYAPSAQQRTEPPSSYRKHIEVDIGVSCHKPFRILGNAFVWQFPEPENDRGFIFVRYTRTHISSLKGETPFAAWAESLLRKAEIETGIADINLHRFRHTCATARLSSGWQLIRISRMLGHSSMNTTALHYAEYDLSASPAGFEGMVKVYGEFVRWLDEGYFA